MLNFLRQCYLRMCVMAHLHERILPEYATYDPASDVWTVHGIRYAGELFRFFAEADTGTLFRIVGRDRQTVTVETLPALGTEPFVRAVRRAIEKIERGAPNSFYRPPASAHRAQWN